MSSTHSSDPLLGPPSPDDDESTLVDGYFQSRQHPQDLYIEASAAGQQSAESGKADCPPSPHSAISSSLALSEAEWLTDTGSTYSEEHLLLWDNTPPPSYERADSISDIRQPAVGDRGSSNSLFLFGNPKVFVPATLDPPQPLIDIDIEPQHWDRSYNRYFIFGQREERREKFRHFYLKFSNVILALAIFALVGLAAALTIWARALFGWNSVCLIKNFVSRDYQIQNLEHFDFSNTNTQNSGLPRRFSGVMHVLSGPPHQIADLNVTVRSTVSDIHSGKRGADWRPSNLISCAEVDLYFRPGLVISNLRIQSNNLKLVLSSDIIVSGASTISLKKGQLISQNFGSSRETFIDINKGTVTGDFGLHDVLSIKKQSGSMSIDINPKPVPKGRPRPAVLKVESRSGTVNINYPANETDIPNREYRSTIISRSGTVNGMILHGKETTIKTKSGNLNVQILPYGADRTSSSLTTTMESGASTIELLRPHSRRGNPLARLHSSHKSRSGLLKLKYPNEWHGYIHGVARSGSLSLTGTNVEVTDRGTIGGRKYIHAQKGSGTNRLNFDIKSGAVDAIVGS
jgi:hypothetical protein